MDETSTTYVVPNQQQPQPPQQQLTNNPQQHTELQRKQFIQKQLVLLLHAHKCQQREKQTMNGETTRSNPCTLPHCSTMKNVLQHMTKCNDHKTCTVAHCVTSRQIILHWKQCSNPQCPICQPLKTPSTLAKLNQTNTIGMPSNNSNTTIPSSSSSPTTTNPNLMNERSTTKDWQKRVTPEMRQHLVQKIIAALIPITDTGAIRDKRIISLSNYARHVENDTFEIANNQEEYFHKLAEKIYKIQKELEERREKKRLQDMQLIAQISSTSSTNDFNSKIHPTMDTMAGDYGPPNRIAPTTDYVSSTGTISHQPLTSVTNSNRTLSSLNGITNANMDTHTATNVPPNENSNFQFYNETTANNQQQNVDMTNGISQRKNELISPNTSIQVYILKFVSFLSSLFF